jgi:N-acetylmuramoyl-L-alanine amidase
MRKITDIVIHCSATREGQHFDVTDIRSWHLARGFADIGYHYVILLDGTIQNGRPLDRAGAHVAGHNARSIGICYIGGVDAWNKPKDTRTEAQQQAMRQLVADLVLVYPDAEVKGHRDFPGVAKDCPCFDVKEWWSQTYTAKPTTTLIQPKETPKAHQVILIDHVVKKGDTLWGIAQKYGVRTDDVFTARLSYAPAHLVPGEKLLIVQKGGPL